MDNFLNDPAVDEAYQQTKQHFEENIPTHHIIHMHPGKEYHHEVLRPLLYKLYSSGAH